MFLKSLQSDVVLGKGRSLLLRRCLSKLPGGPAVGGGRAGAGMVMVMHDF